MEQQHVFFIRVLFQTQHGEGKVRFASKFLRRRPELPFCTFWPIPAGYPRIPSFSEPQLLLKPAIVSTESAEKSQITQKDQFRTFYPRVRKRHQTEKVGDSPPPTSKKVPWKKQSVIRSGAQTHHPFPPSSPLFGCGKTKRSILLHLSKCPNSGFSSALNVRRKLYEDALYS